MKGLKVLRKSQNLTQAELAAKTGISRVSVTRYETGERSPSIKAAQKLAAALGCTIDELVKNA